MEDDFGDYDDIIELYNPTNVAVNLSGYFLSDDPEYLTKWIFPEYEELSVLQPGAYRVLWADNEPHQGLNHLPFSLDKSGESVVLTEPDAITIVDQIDYQNQQRDVSYGRSRNSQHVWFYFPDPSIGFQNSTNGFEGIALEPHIIPNSSFINGLMTVEIINPDPNQEVYYSFKQTHPTTTDNPYSEEIIINQTKILNAKAFRAGYLASETSSALYLIDQNFTLPVLALLADSLDIWGSGNGIYTNYLEEGPQWEKSCLSQFIVEDSLMFSINSGLRIQGRSSRSRPKKSFRIFFKSAYDRDRLEYPVFGNSAPQSYKNLVLRAGYDDDIQMTFGTLIRDPLVSSIWKDLGMLVSKGNFSNLYINDQYWGIYNIRESINEHFIKDNTGYLDFDLIRYLKWNTELKHGSIDAWNEINTFIRTRDFSNNQNYLDAKNKIDIETFLNLQALIICSEYRSWTWGASVYREQSPLSKWKWTIWDMDRAFTNVNWNGFTILDDTTGLYKPNIFANRLLKNDQFRFQFINRVADFLNSIFLPENVITKIDSLEALLDYDITHESDRWGRSTQVWRNNVNSLRIFSESRPGVVKQQMIEYFSLDGESDFTITSNAGGHIKLNTIKIDQFPWEGTYFKGVPVILEAIPAQGYVFNGWSGDYSSESSSITVVPDLADIALHAHFSENNTNVGLQIVTPLLKSSSGRHPVVLRYYDDYGNIIKNNHSISARIRVNGAIIEPSIALNKGVGSYILDLEGSMNDVTISAYIEEYEETNESIISAIPAANSTALSGSLPPGETVWVSNSKIFINTDLYVPNGSILEIQEGSQICMGQHVNIIINGQMEIKGTRNNPVLFSSVDADEPWGGIEFYGSNSSIDYCYFLNGGGDPDKGWQHTQTQPIIFARENSDLSLENIFILNSPGKALGAHNSVVNVDSSIISFVFHGGEFHYSHLTFKNSYVLNIPNDDGIFVDDDNDGFHIDYVHPSIDEPSYISNSFFINGKDDAIDHHRARLKIDNCWINNWMNEGIAASGADTLRVSNTIIQNCSNGFEAGWGSPNLYIDHCTAMNNGVGFKFGDNYSTPSTGSLIMTNSIAFNNDDNIKNYTNHLSGPFPGGIQVSYSMANDPDYDDTSTNFTGVPAFRDNFRISHNSTGASMGTRGKNVGLVDPTIIELGPVVINEIMYKASSDYDSGDWVELYNPHDDTINISFWNLRDENDDHNYIIPENTSLPPRSFMVLCRDQDKFRSVYSHQPDILGNFTFGFGVGDQVRVFSSTFSIVDSVEYGFNGLWPSEPNSEGPSLELVDIQENEDPEFWSASFNVGGTPGLTNSATILNNMPERNLIASEYKLEQNYPNPFNGKTIIEYKLAKDSKIDIAVFDINGRRVDALVSGFKEAGIYRLNWNPRDHHGHTLPTGIYFYRLITDEYSIVKKMLYVK